MNYTTEDLCGICGGNDSCLDCFNEPNGTAELDQCGICGGDGHECEGCDGLFSVPALYVRFFTLFTCNGIQVRFLWRMWWR